jgi:hypothetical protein
MLILCVSQPSVLLLWEKSLYMKAGLHWYTGLVTCTSNLRDSY